jgi:hypothetical protein
MSDEKITTIKAFSERILSGVQADIDDLRRGGGAMWFGPGSPCFIELTKPLPFDEYSVAIAVFQNDSVIRVYTLPAVPPTPRPAAWKTREPMCYTLTKLAPTYVFETMSLETMADEIVDEWNELAVEMSSAEAEREAVIDYIESFGAEPIGAMTLAQEIRDEVHLEDDDDEGDEPLNGTAQEPASPTIPAPPGAPAQEVKAS